MFSSNLLEREATANVTLDLSRINPTQLQTKDQLKVCSIKQCRDRLCCDAKYAGESDRKVRERFNGRIPDVSVTKRTKVAVRFDWRFCNFEECGRSGKNFPVGSYPKH